MRPASVVCIRAALTLNRPRVGLLEPLQPHNVPAVRVLAVVDGGSVR
jgi:hypothetical protein